MRIRTHIDPIILSITRGMTRTVRFTDRIFVGKCSLLVDLLYEVLGTHTVAFIGPRLGTTGPVAMRSGGHVFMVCDAETLGAFGSDWVHRFYARAYRGSATASR